MPRPLSYELREAGKRMADQINGRLAFSDPFELRSKWMAFDLNDGTTKGEVYDSMADAKRFTDEFKTCYFAFVNYLGGISAYECSIFLDFQRAARDANLGQRDPNTTAFMSTHGHDVMGHGIN